MAGGVSYTTCKGAITMRGRCWAIIDPDAPCHRRILAVVDNEALAGRIVELLERHGLVDVPDDARGLEAT